MKALSEMTDEEVMQLFEDDLTRTSVISPEFKSTLRMYMRAMQSAAYRRGKDQ